MKVLLAPGARRHVSRMLAAFAPRADAVAQAFTALLQTRGFGTETIAQLHRITPAAACRARSLDAFFPAVERGARELARLHITPEVAAATLHDFDRLLGAALAGRFQPAREQLQSATVFTLYRAFYELREAEIRRLE